MRQLALLSFILSFALPVLAETVACPELATAVQAGTCPSEDELQYTFNGYCSDNARMYDAGSNNACTDYRLYRKMKNVALWEAGSDFQGYVSCDLPAERLKQLKATSITVARKGTLTRIVCRYPDDVSFVYRTKAKCRVEATDDCAASGACRATCE